MPNAIITIGPPASGKSHMANILCGSLGYVEVNLDDCREAVSGDAGNQACLRAALVIWNHRLEVAMSRGWDVIVSDTNLHPGFRADLVARLVARGYTVNEHKVNTPLVVCLARNASRARRVPMHAMTRMFEMMEA
jgi:predicted kinase